jgi:hypothetical protein
LLALALGVACGLVPSWAAPPQDVVGLRRELDSTLSKVTVPVLRHYTANLQALERKAAAARDYELAIRLRDERHRYEGTITDQERRALAAAVPVSAAAVATTAIDLPLSAAQLQGVRLDSGLNRLTGWSSAGASAVWALPKLPPGGYEVVLTYESGALEGGSVVVQEAFYSLSADLRTTLKGPEAHSLGTLRIRSGDGQLKLTAKTVLRDSLMQLVKVELIPTAR